MLEVRVLQRLAGEEAQEIEKKGNLGPEGRKQARGEVAKQLAAYATGNDTNASGRPLYFLTIGTIVGVYHGR